ncbi:metallophosphoesterase [Tundrisphaera lichenicola]|uniref:metallophosphoesterase n=1 Tax=Tundrisphaera lichenicola TaxID=2029860 RepID=UPI003EBF4B83
MMADWLVLISLVIGHLALFVLTLNLLHSTNVPEKLLDVLNLTLLSATLIALPFLVTQGPWTSWAILPKAYGALCLGTTWIGLPAVTLLRACRRTPAGVATRGEEINLGAILGRDRMVGEGGHWWMLRLPGNHSLRLQRVECDLNLPGLPPALDGLNIVQVTDLHFSDCYRREFFEIVAEEAARWEADLITFTGDLLDDPETMSWVEPVLSKLRGRLGQFAILGNHDHRLRPGRARRALRRAGFEDLEGRWTRLELDGAALAIGGTSEPWGPQIDYNSMPEADFRILLSHSPDQFPRASSRGVDLVLAGHNHGGQIRLPVFGPLLMPSRYSRHFDRGFFRAGSSLLYVSQGVAGKHPIRYGCFPEITRFTLRATPAARPPHSQERSNAELIREY